MKYQRPRQMLRIPFLNRVLALILLFTPSLGLFNTLHHGRLAAHQVGVDPVREKFDYIDGGRGVEFQEAWEQFRIDDPFEFVEMPAIAVLATMLTMFFFHIVATSSILKLKLKSKELSSLFLNSLYNLISPPLHYDWEFFYRESSEEDAILNCWKRQVLNLYSPFPASKSKLFTDQRQCLSSMFFVPPLNI